MKKKEIVNEKDKVEAIKEIKITDKDMIKYLQHKINELTNERDHLKNVELNVAIDNNNDDYFIDIRGYIDEIENIVDLIADSIERIKGGK